MKAVILAGGLGSRLSEETDSKPKPMVEIGGKPILWHILKIYSTYNINDFIICCGYKGYLIKEYFSNYFLHNSDVTFDLKNNKLEIHSKYSESWNVTLVDTGENTMTGGRLRRIRNYLDNEDFCFTYGDGLSDININDLINFHYDSKSLATLTAVQPPGRFGSLEVDQNSKVNKFFEKPQGDGGWINGGFFVLNPKVIDYIEGDQTIWEQEPLRNLARDNKLSAYKHIGFWHPMDTLRDKKFLDELWKANKSKWKVWK